MCLPTLIFHPHIPDTPSLPVPTMPGKLPPCELFLRVRGKQDSVGHGKEGMQAKTQLDSTAKVQTPCGRTLHLSPSRWWWWNPRPGREKLQGTGTESWALPQCHGLGCWTRRLRRDTTLTKKPQPTDCGNDQTPSSVSCKHAEPTGEDCALCAILAVHMPVYTLTKPSRAGFIGFIYSCIPRSGVEQVFCGIHQKRGT